MLGRQGVLFIKWCSFFPPNTPCDQRVNRFTALVFVRCCFAYIRCSRLWWGHSCFWWLFHAVHKLSVFPFCLIALLDKKAYSPLQFERNQTNDYFHVSSGTWSKCLRSFQKFGIRLIFISAEHPWSICKRSSEKWLGLSGLAEWFLAVVVWIDDLNLALWRRKCARISYSYWPLCACALISLAA